MADPRLLFLMRRINEAHRKHFNNKTIRILDIGCSDGSFINILEKHLSISELIDGVDVPSQWFEKQNIQTSGKIFTQDLQLGTGDIPLGIYHIVTFWEVLEHIENVYLFLENVKKLLIPEGILLMTTPNLLSVSRFVKKSRWVGIAEKDHKYLFDKLSLSMILTRSGFNHVKMRSYYFPSLNASFDKLNNLLGYFPGGGMLLAEAKNMLI